MLLNSLLSCGIILSENETEDKTMAKRNTREGWYTFEDGTAQWTRGFSAQERAREIREHGRIIHFEPTDWFN